MIRRLRLTNDHLLERSAHYPSLNEQARRGLRFRISLHLEHLVYAASETKFVDEYTWIAEAFSQWETFSYAVVGRGGRLELPLPRRDLKSRPDMERSRTSVLEELIRFSKLRIRNTVDVRELFRKLVADVLPICNSVGQILESVARLQQEGIVEVSPGDLTDALLDELEATGIAWLLIGRDFLEDEIPEPEGRDALALEFNSESGTDSYTFAPDEMPRTWKLLGDATSAKPTLLERLQSDDQVTRFTRTGGADGQAAHSEV